MDPIVKELLDAANEVVGNLMSNYHDSRAVSDDVVRLCAAIVNIEDKFMEWKDISPDTTCDDPECEGAPLHIKADCPPKFLTT